MSEQTVFFVGTELEIAHHAASVQQMLSDRAVKVVVAAPSLVLESAAPGDLAVFYSEHFDRFRDCCTQLKQRGIATLYMIDGILEWRNAWENRQDEPACPWTMRPVLSHKVACIGPSQARVLTAWKNGPKIEVTGVPRFDGLVEAWKQRRCESSADHPTQTGNKKPEWTVLVMTARFPGFTEEQIENTRRSLVDVKQFFESQPEVGGRPVRVIWRLTRGMDQQIGVENSVAEFTGVGLEKVLGSVDAVITTPSTAMLEAMLFDRPVAMLEYNRNPHYVPPAWHIAGPSDVAPVIQSLADPDRVRMSYQDQVISDSLLVGECSASERMALLITKMLEIVRGGAKPDFPADMLPAVAAFEPQFLHRRIYSGYEGFDTSEISELQANEAASRRVINTLRTEINQLKLELAEAHRIFEQIENHPVAGPVVRARAKLLDWVNRFSRAGKLDDENKPFDES